MPVASRLTLAIRTALLLAAASGNAWAATAESTDDSAQSLTLDATNVNARYLGPHRPARGARWRPGGPWRAPGHAGQQGRDGHAVQRDQLHCQDPRRPADGDRGRCPGARPLGAFYRADWRYCRLGFRAGVLRLARATWASWPMTACMAWPPTTAQFTEYAERVEVLKGPGALMYGISPNSGVGGVINIVPKRPAGPGPDALYRQLCLRHPSRRSPGYQPPFR